MPQLHILNISILFYAYRQAETAIYVHKAYIYYMVVIASIVIYGSRKHEEQISKYRSCGQRVYSL
jgi:hypothetical protein